MYLFHSSIVHGRINTYKIIDTLTRTRTSSLYISQNVVINDTDEKKYYVLKYIPYKYIHLALQEIRILKRLLNCKGVVQFIEDITNTNDNSIIIVIDYCKGRELYYEIEENQLTYKDKRIIFKKLCEIMDRVHSLGVVHRDLKPENIIVYDNEPIIIDWGLSFIPKETAERKSCGSLNYVAPEIVMEENYGTEVDVWSLGAILYVCMTKTLLFYDKSDAQTYKNIIECKVDYTCKGLDPQVIQLLKKILVKENRATIKEILADPWFSDDILEKSDQRD